MLRRVVLGGLFAAIAAAGIAIAADSETFVHEGAQIEFSVPADWKHEVDKADPDWIKFWDKSEEHLIYCEVVKAADFKHAVDELDKEISKLIQDVKVEKHDEHKLNGLDALWIDGHGKHDGTPVHLYVDFVATPNHHIFMMVTFVEASKWEKHKDVLMKVFESVKAHKK